jgi:hypothetical protein
VRRAPDIGTGDPACQDVAGSSLVPTLGAVALAVLAILVAVAGVMLLRRQRRQPA